MDKTTAQQGHFYAIGVGPGSSDMLTIRAARLLEQSDAVFAPQAQNSTRCLALEAARPYLDAAEVVVSSYPMRRDAAATGAHWGKLAQDIASRCAAGQVVAQITLGDPLIYATTSYLLAELTALMDSARLHIVPGISAFQISASRFGLPLTLQEDRLTLMTATDLDAVDQALDNCETLVLYKAGGNIDALLKLLQRRDLLAATRLVSCGEQGERELIIDDLSHWQKTELNYMTTVIVRSGHRRWQRDND